MGLDMYLEGRKFLFGATDPKDNPTEDGFRVTHKTLRLGYWRKHPNLHGYIVKMFAGGQDECQDIPLDEDALQKLLCAVKDKALPHTEGFFFGASDGSEQDEDVKILTGALEWLRARPKGEARDVVYRASW
jgi:hypothetical protein